MDGAPPAADFRASGESYCWRPLPTAVPEEGLTVPRYLISFDDGSMDHIPDEDWPAVAAASHRVVEEAREAGVWIFGGGIRRQRASVVDPEGNVTPGPLPETKAVLGGFAVVEVPSRTQALAWAARIAVGCRCAQEVREIMHDPTA